jgi:uncharacterized phage protein gp47/JayE
MSKYGVTETGFIPKDFEIIKSEFAQDLINIFGAINLNAPSTFSQISDITSHFATKLWDQVQADYNSHFLSTATGVSLDYQAFLKGLSRLLATYSTVACQCTGENNLVIPFETKVGSVNNEISCLLTNDFTIKNTACYSVLIQVSGVLEDQVLNIKINDTTASYTVQADDTIADIVSALVSVLESEQAITDIVNIESLNESNIRITIKDSTSSFACYLPKEADDNVENIVLVNVTSTAIFRSENVGEIYIPALSINTIKTPVDGFISVTNVTQGKTGRNLENDIDFRQRIQAANLGTSSIDAIFSRLLNIPDVKSVEVKANDTNETQGDMLPHSIKAIVLGGDDEVIANTLWNVKGAGIPTVGNTEVNILDRQKQQQVVKFDRPIQLYVFIKIILTTTDAYLYSYDNIIKANLVKKINTNRLGKTILYQSLYSEILMPEITNIVLTLASNTTGEEPAQESYATANVVLGSNQMSFTEESKITIS